MVWFISLDIVLMDWKYLGWMGLIIVFKIEILLYLLKIKKIKIFYVKNVK